jgi:hypothetical protein
MNDFRSAACVTKNWMPSHVVTHRHAPTERILRSRLSAFSRVHRDVSSLNRRGNSAGEFSMGNAGRNANPASREGGI